MTQRSKRADIMNHSDPTQISCDHPEWLQQRLDWYGNPNLKLGKVEEKDAGSIIAEILTKDDSLVERLEVDRRSGWTRPLRPQEPPAPPKE